MLYNLTDQFIKINETTGTIQNTSHIYSVEVSHSPDNVGGILLFPLQKVSFSNQTIYLRCIDGESEARVVPFEVDSGGGGSSVAAYPFATLTLDTIPSSASGSMWLSNSGAEIQTAVFTLDTIPSSINGAMWLSFSN